MRAVLIGIGQAGGKVTEALVDFDRGLGAEAVPDAIAINSAVSDLQSLSIDTKLVGRSLVSGHGVGGDNELGAEVMDESATEVVNAVGGRISADADAVFLVAGLGGGTGSGGAPVLARELKRVYDIPVYALGILPGRDEGSMYYANAGRSMKTLTRETDGVLLIDNDAWREEGESLGSAYEAINERIARRVGLLLAAGEISDGVGQSVVDASEVINTLREGGIAALGYASAAAGEEAAENVNTITSLVRRALLSDMSLPEATDARAALVVVAGRPAAIPRRGVERARKWIEEETGTMQVRGGDFPVDDDRLAAIVLLSGLERTNRVDEIMAEAKQAQEARAAGGHDPVEALVSEDIDDLF